MECDATNRFTAEFLGTNGDGPNFEVNPVEFRLELNEQDYDFGRMKLPAEVGNEMKPHTATVEGDLSGYRTVRIHWINDGSHTMNYVKGENAVGVPPEKVSLGHLLFRPDWAEYGQQYTTIELYDIHKALEDGTLDMTGRSQVIWLIYRDVVNEVDNDLIQGVEFVNIPDEIVGGRGGLFPERSREWRTESEREIRRTMQDIDNRDFSYDFEDISPEQAIAELNDMYQVRSWVDREDKILKVGFPNTQFNDGNHHIAAPDDNRVWRYKETSVRHKREPIKAAVCIGQWVDEPGIDLMDTGRIISFAAGNSSRGGGDVRALGIAERTDIPQDAGTFFSINAKRAKKTALPGLARNALERKRLDESLGTITINTRASGNEMSHPVNVRPGDTIRIVPDDRYFENPSYDSGVLGNKPDRDKYCGIFTYNDLFYINKVVHKTTEDGMWEVELGVARYDSEIQVETRRAYLENDGTIKDDLDREGVTAGFRGG